MSIQATCGHVLSKEIDGEFGFNITIKDHQKNFDKTVSYPIVCKKCLRRYKKLDLLLENEKEINNWLSDHSQSSLNS